MGKIIRCNNVIQNINNYCSCSIAYTGIVNVSKYNFGGVINMARPKLYNKQTKCSSCNKKQAVVKGLCWNCYYKQRRSNNKIGKYTQARREGKRLTHYKQEHYPLIESDVSVSAITRVGIHYTDTVTIDTGIFLGYPIHSMFVWDNIRI